jgi:hypothetical protein
MRRRLLDLCLLAYPRARRQRDRDYLRDLALDLAETQGLRRQAWSLLVGGLGERIGRPAQRALVACLVLAAPAGWLLLPGGGDRVGVSDVEHVCEVTEDAGSETTSRCVRG